VRHCGVTILSTLSLLSAIPDRTADRLAGNPYSSGCAGHHVFRADRTTQTSHARLGQARL
jgi:hypothetical protein